MEGKYSRISFCRESYRQYYDCLGKEDINYEVMYDDIKNFIRIAIQNGYQCKFWSDEITVVVEYNYQDECLSGVSLEWLNENEYIAECSEGDEE